MSKQTGTKRDIFAELMEGVEAMGGRRAGKLTLRTHSLPAPEVEESPGAEFFVAVRERFNVSRAVWANMLRVSPRTVEKWEQGGQVSPLAATFVDLISKFPDTVDRLQTLPKRVARLPIAFPTDRSAITVKQLFSAAGLPVCGPVRWKEENVPESQPGVYVVATVSSPDDDAGLDYVSGLREEAAHRWIPSQPVLYVGQTTRPLSVRVKEFYRHKPGFAAPHSGGEEVISLECAKWVYWSPTKNSLDAESKMIEEFETRVRRLPFGNLKRPARVKRDLKSDAVSF